MTARITVNVTADDLERIAHNHDARIELVDPPHADIVMNGQRYRFVASLVDVPASGSAW